MKTFTFTKLGRAALIAAALALSAVWLAGCGADNGNPCTCDAGGGGGTDTGSDSTGGDNTGGDNTGGGDAVSLVGDWLPESVNKDGETIYADNDDPRRSVLSFRASGDYAEFHFDKVGDVWIESSLTTTWSASGSTLYTVTTDALRIMEARFRISGEKLILSHIVYEECDDNGCHELLVDAFDEATYTRVNADDVRRSLGAVYTTDPRLSAAEGYDRLIWYLQDDEEVNIEFNTSYANGNGVNRYTGFYSSARCYTNGGKLVLIGEICNWDADNERPCMASDPVELDYGITGAGGDTRLTINGDIWLPANSADYRNSRGGDDDGLAKSKQGKRPTGLGNAVGGFIFPFFAQSPPPVKR